MKISQDAFADAVTGHFIPLETEPTLAQAGVDARTLGRIVGADGVLDRTEAEALYARLARDAKGDVAARRLLDGIDDVDELERELHPAWRPPTPPRTPSAEARATFREDAARLAEGLNALRERAVPEPHDRATKALFEADLTYKSLELWELTGIGHASATMGLGIGIVGPIVGTAAALAKIGHANEEGRLEGERLHAIDAYAAGVAACLDPSEAAPRPTDPTMSALYDQGFFEANALTPTERRDLEDRLVLVAEHASQTGSTRYAAPTYAGALARLVGMGHWDPAAR